MFLLYAQMCFWYASNGHIGFCKICNVWNTVCFSSYLTFRVSSCCCGEAPARFYVCHVVVVRVLRMRFAESLWNAMKMQPNLDFVCNLWMWRILIRKQPRKCLVRTAATLKLGGFTSWKVRYFDYFIGFKASRRERDLSAFYSKRRSTSTGGISRTWHFQGCVIVKLACGCIGGMCLESSEVIWADVSRRFWADWRESVVF